MAAPSLTPGQNFSHFRLIEELGAGGMGVVYRAWDLRLERDVAIKVLNPESTKDSSARARFRREALFLSRLNHPNVEAVYDFHSEEGMDYLVLEYVPGISLNDQLLGGALAEKEVLGLGIQLARGLAVAHAHRVLHRDLKPGNLRVTPDNVLKIIDFGLSQLFATPEDDTVTVPEIAQHPAAGTPAYLAPEQVQGNEPDTRSDIYSAGVVLYEMSTGARLFPQHGEALRDAIVHTQPPGARTENPAISPALEAVILKCLEKDPRSRYQSANELLADLEDIDKGEATTASDPSWRGSRAGVWRRKRGLLAFAAMLLLGTVAGVLAWKWRAPPHVQQRIMAVLPMDTIGQDPATSALGLGLTETVAAKLVEASNSDAIQVVSPRDLRDQGVKTAEEARREFGTDLVLESSLQRMGQTVRINCYLVDAKTRRQLAAKTIEAEMTDAFALQDQVVSAALDMLPAQIRPEERRRLNANQDTQPAAYEAYIRGRGYLQEYEKPENIDSAISEFKRALTIDSNYALGYAGLG